MVQAQSIAGGGQENYDPWRTATSVGLGSVIGGTGAAIFGRRLEPSASHVATSAPHMKVKLSDGVGSERLASNVQDATSRALVPWEGPITLDRLTQRSPEQILTAAQTTERGKWAFSLFGDSIVQYFDKKDATLGRHGHMQYHIPLEDSGAIRNVANAYKETGAAGTVEKAYKEGGKVFGVIFSLEGRSVRPPTRADAGISEHYLEGGTTALALPDRAGFLVNETRELVSPGGDKMPYGSMLVSIENGKRIVKRTWP